MLYCYDFTCSTYRLGIGPIRSCYDLIRYVECDPYAHFLFRHKKVEKKNPGLREESQDFTFEFSQALLQPRRYLRVVQGD